MAGTLSAGSGSGTPLVPDPEPSDDAADAGAYRLLVSSQVEALDAIKASRCTPACVAATDAESECDCVCEGDYHASVWSREFPSVHGGPGFELRHLRGYPYV